MAVAAQALCGMAGDERPAVLVGGRILAQCPAVFPQRRRCRDGFSALLFLSLFAVLAFVAFSEVREIPSQQREHILPLKSLGVTVLITVIAACCLSLLFAWLTKVCTKLVVWVALLLFPCGVLCCVLVALLRSTDMGESRQILCLGAPSLLYLVCLYCWRHLVPVTVDILREVAIVMGQNLMIVPVGILGALASLVWSVLVTAAVIAGTKYSAAHGNLAYVWEESMAMYFLLAIVLMWGLMVCANTCHVTYCGVFGRWYFGLAASVPSCLRTAITTSFGSVCLGSLVIATVTAFEVVLGRLQSQARSAGGNPAVQCILCILRCLVACIVDIVEAVSCFAFVEVAVRGLSFLDAARLTFAIYKFRSISAVGACSLVGSVVGIGTAFCGVVAGGLGSAAGIAALSLDAETDQAVVQAWCTLARCLGVLLGTMVTGNIIYALRSGFATVCMCWAEDSEKCGTLAPNLDQLFQRRVQLRGRN